MPAPLVLTGTCGNFDHVTRIVITHGQESIYGRHIQWICLANQHSAANHFSVGIVAVTVLLIDRNFVQNTHTWQT